MIGRITSQTIQRSTLANLQSNLSAISTLQAQQTSGKKVAKASDDPVHAAQLMSLKAERARADQYDRNNTDATSWLTSVDDALQNASSTIRRVRDLVIQGGNDSLPQDARQGLATEITALRDSLRGTANTTYLGRNVFAGTSAADEAFDDTYTWSGTSGGEVQRKLADQTTVRVDSDGTSVFGEGATSVFALLDTIAATLSSGSSASSSITQLDGFATNIKNELASVGARENTVEDSASQLASRMTSVEIQISGIEDIDLAETILQLQSQNVAYQAALGAASQVLTPSLLEFLQ